jgi:hypothetical protein
MLTAQSKLEKGAQLRGSSSHLGMFSFPIQKDIQLINRLISHPFY